MIQLTERAEETLARAGTAAARFDPDIRVRVARAGSGVRFELADRAEPDDLLVERPAFTLLVEHGLAGIIDVEEPHDRLVLRPFDEEQPAD